MKIPLLIAIGGATGALARYGITGALHNAFGTQFPYGTLVVNMLGSFSLGIIYVLVEEKHWLGPEWRALIAIGLLGALTTFSTFSLETIKLLSSGAVIRALLNTMANLIFCLLLTWVAIIAGRQL